MFGSRRDEGSKRNLKSDTNNNDTKAYPGYDPTLKDPNSGKKYRNDDAFQKAFKEYETTDEYQYMINNLQGQILEQKKSIKELKIITDNPLTTEEIMVAHQNSMPNFLHPSIEHELRQLRNERESLQRAKNQVLEQQDLKNELDNGFREIETMKMEILRTILDHVKISTLAQFPFPMPPMYPPQPPQVVTLPHPSTYQPTMKGTQQNIRDISQKFDQEGS